MEDLKILSTEIEAERKLLSDVVDNISSFVETYQTIKSAVVELKGDKDFSLQTAVNNINSSLLNTQKALNEYNGNLIQNNKVSKNIGEEVEKLQSQFQEINKTVGGLNNKMQEFLTTQTKALSAIAKLDEYMSNIKNIDFSSLDKKITNYSENIEKLSETIQNDVSHKIEENNQKVQKIETSINNLVDKLANNNVGELLNQLKTMNALISETQKEKFALNQELDVELNAWADRNGVKRKRK